MMETKLWTALCALLLVHLGSAQHDQAASSESALSVEVPTKAPAAAAVPTSGLEPTHHSAPAPITSSNGTSSLSSNTTTSQAPKKTDNDTNIVTPSVSVAPQNNTNKTESTPPQILPSESHTSHSLKTTTTTTTTTNTTTTTTTSPSHTPHNVTVDTLATNTTTSPQPPPSTSHSVLPTQPKTTSSSSTTTTTAATNNSTEPGPTSSIGSSQEPSSPESHTLMPKKQPTVTITPMSSSSTQSKGHANTPSQLNVGVDTTMVHDSPTLDPLLAGLVSAFIITAVIITLLLFLKLRRRDNRPEFRRLQDLPMDDMMEDTPLSMYSY